ncbi:DUF2487 family protein [Pseudogracilibacillus auburnensis]|uniref:Uncharacterized protein DUF2487 n=1 Tax=Pseudogracilibacillus auburnensis TaxID=1494959 RepID=A0A2V3W6E0_9BACI|nr:DUF2487 family protein [Pseudogracilibacillus auburnensis]MBO1003042.1 DUF2487 family protein [Pseudogracilibacillus auburnensis]PXW88754.1 uncharacterized protein DUF2487 [Pseudogracilibacillus auburnensis]
MKWFSEDLTKYIQAKEYIDTVIIPLQAFHLSEDNSLKKDAFQREVLSIYAREIEKELSGRILLTPTYNYLKFSDIDREVNRLNEWLNDIGNQPFKTVFAMTFDNSWKKIEKELDCHLLWLPGIKSGNIKSEETLKVIRSQVEQISELIRSYW